MGTMPPRIARSSVQSAAPKAGKNKARKRNLDAFAIASHSAPEKNQLKASRLGEFLDDRPHSKRRRDEEDGEDSDESADAPPKRRRPAPQDEDVEEGSDSSGNEWMVGGMREDDNDSELDSDDAFGESDEEKFEGFTFRGSKIGAGKKKMKASSSKRRIDEKDEEINLDEPDSLDEDEEVEDDFGDEGVDLATMLDEDDEELLGGKDTTGRDMGEAGSSEESDDDESNVDADTESSDNEDEEEERVARMRDRIDALDASAEPVKTAFRLSQPSALTVEDLLADLDPAQKKQFESALKVRKKSERPKTLTAPLPKRQQDKLNREEASKKAKEQLDRWQDTVIRNRRAEFLSFPLKDPNKSEKLGKDKFVMGEEQVPANELERNIRQIMEESGLATKPGNKAEDEEDMLLKAEELATNKLPVEEVMQRRAELRRARELLFREEIKAKRIKKIKSKAYRRVHRKERLRQEKLDEEMNAEMDLDEDEQSKFERKRAEARMSTKHKDSKFAKAMSQTNRSVWHDGARETVIDEARRREELQRRIRGEEISDDSAEGRDVPSGSDDDSDGNEEASTLKALGRLKDDAGAERKGLSAMKFMQAADARQRAQNGEDVERMRKELAIADGEEAESDGEVEDQGLGRAIFGPKSQEERKSGALAKRGELEEGEESGSEPPSDGENEEVILTEKQQPNAKSSNQKASKRNNPLANAFHSEPEGRKGNWLTSTSVKKDKKRNPQRDGILDMDMSAVLEDTNRPRSSQVQSKSNSQQQPVRERESQAASADGWTVVKHPDQNSDEQEDEEPTDPILRNQAMARRMFAGDDAIQASFDAEKASAVASEDEKETSNHLPGWGSWTGHGLSRSEKRLSNHRKHHPLHKTKIAGVRKEDRKDAKLENVIISERSNRKGKIYQADMLPRGFETKTQYERSLRLPMGPEWSTKETFQRATRPRVVVRPGVVVEAMERPLV
jgi:U3 small nucleolar RNA-associated protein 14